MSTKRVARIGGTQDGAEATRRMRMAQLEVLLQPTWQDVEGRAAGCRLRADCGTPCPMWVPAERQLSTTAVAQAQEGADPGEQSGRVQ